MVIEQGTAIDRIDFNIQDSVASADMANVQLQTALKKHSMRSTYVLMVFILLISIFTVLLINKHF